ncbi:MAG: hypothetical protein GQ474_00510 [Sulfurimonas sp.]|nr:hypothetical protein [Sulfurimonas sp.]
MDDQSKLEVLSEVRELWDSASALSDLQENRWAANERLARSEHLTPRKLGQSNLFVPKIESMLYRKKADHLFALDGDNPISLTKTLTSSKAGAKIMERVCNYYLKEAGGINWRSNVLNVSSDALTYNFAPWFADWDRGVEEFEEEVETLDENGDIVLETVKSERETFSYATLENIPPEDMRIDPAVGWDEVGMSRFGIVRRWRDKSFAQRMHKIGRWAEVDDSVFQSNQTTAIGNVVKTERAHQNGLFDSATDIDNGLIEVWYSFYYQEMDDGEYVPVVTTSITDQIILEEPTELEFNLANSDGTDPWNFGVGRIYYTPHEMYDRALPEKLESGNVEVNAIRNQRRDNVSLVLNREKYMTPDAGIDPAVLSRSFSGKVNVVKTKGSVWWDAPPDVTGSSYNEENMATNDMERLVAESASRSGGSSGDTATEVKISSANSSATATLDTTVLNETFGIRFAHKLIRMIRQTADPEIFYAAAADIAVEVQDPYAEALQGDFLVQVGAGAMQAARDVAISNTANTVALLQSAYGANANYQPLFKTALEMQGYNVDEIIPNPQGNQGAEEPAFNDLGGVAGVDNLTVQPNVQLSGGQFGASPQGN